MILSVSAIEVIEVDEVRPDIDASFDEVVVLISFDLNYTADDSSVPLDNSTTDNQNFIFTPKENLLNGFYNFIVNAEDEIGNPKEFRRTIVVDVDKPDIFFIEPPLGISTIETFNIIIETSKPANCRADLLSNKPYEDMSDFFDTTGSTQHRKSGFTGLNINGRSILPPLYVKCLDQETSQVTEQELVIGFDNTAPNVEWTRAEEEPVITDPGQTTITLRTDDMTVCFLGGTIFEGQRVNDFTDYGFLPSHTINFAGPEENGQKSYSIICQNLAGLSSGTQTVNVEVDLSDELRIFVNSPGEYTLIPLIYDISTNKLADCSATLVGIDSAQDLTPLNVELTKHNLVYADADIEHNQTYLVQFECTGEDETKATGQRFLVDTTPPNIPLINASACESDKIDLQFFSIDEESGIVGYNYSVFGDNVDAFGFTSGNTATATGLNLVFGNTYSAQAKARNGAGGFSSFSTAKIFEFNPNITLACQEKVGPTLSLNISETTYGRAVNIVCSDASGCKASSIKFGLSNNESCVPVTAGTNVQLTKPQRVCAEALDIYDNKGTVSNFISFDVTFGSTCLNGFLDGFETDLDCGGDCSGCSVGLICSVNNDCSDNWCVSGTCQKPLCDDEIKNGFETGLDCGGLVCGGCDVGGSCSIDSDCGSNSCVVGICEVTSCSDEVKNGFETDLDCGGSSCDACREGLSCEENSDCASGTCEFGTCFAGELTFAQWAEQNGIDPSDEDGDADGDGLTNIQEFNLGTNPNLVDTDGDGFSDFKEFKADTDPLNEFDFPVSFFFRTVLLFIGIIVLILGVLFLYYFKSDTKTSTNLLVLGFAALVFGLIDWLLFQIPKPILIALSLLGLSAGGYFVYGQKDLIMNKFKGKASQVMTKVIAEPGKAPKAIPEEKVSKEDLAATRRMVEKIRREKEAERRRREKLFSEFGKTATPEKKKGFVIEPIIKRKVISKKKPRVSQIPKKEVKKEIPKKKIPIKKGSAIDRLSRLKGKSPLSSLDRLQLKEDAFSKLSKMQKERTAELFDKLPKSKKNIGELEKLAKKVKKRGKK